MRLCCFFQLNTIACSYNVYCVTGADFDGDHYLGREDLEQVISAITRNALTADEVNYICAKV